MNNNCGKALWIGTVVIIKKSSRMEIWYLYSKLVPD